jgi:hypothetical protein
MEALQAPLRMAREAGPFQPRLLSMPMILARIGSGTWISGFDETEEWLYNLYEITLLFWSELLAIK